MQIFEEQKKKEADLKAKEILLSQQQALPQKVEKKVEGGQGSVWNTGNYFWEEKSVAKWAEERIKAVLGGFVHLIPGGTFKVTKVDKLKGEASVSIRKGKKIVAYDYSAFLKWELSVADGEGTVVASLKGTYELPEVSSDMEDDGEQWEVRPSIKEEMPPGIKSRYEAQLIRKEIPEALRKAIREGLVAELKQK
jgi:activator of HSP90 ATPase